MLTRAASVLLSTTPNWPIRLRHYCQLWKKKIYLQSTILTIHVHVDILQSIPNSFFKILEHNNWNSFEFYQFVHFFPQHKLEFGVLVFVEGVKTEKVKKNHGNLQLIQPKCVARSENSLAI